MPLAILYSPELKEYDFGTGHPFRGDRYDVFPRFLRKNVPEDDNYCFIETSSVTEDDLLLICDKEYIDITSEYFKAAYLGLTFPGNFYEFQSGDNQPIGTPGNIEKAARLVIGQAKEACDLIQMGKYQKVVSIGGGLHHAKRRYGEGFCLYNDVAFCGLYLKKNYHLDRVLILDTDAHAGNGTSEYFYEDPEVLFIDIHQDPRTIYPGTGFTHQIGEKAGKGYTINIPLPERSGEKSYRLVFEAVVEPVVNEYKPQIIIRNGGSDPHFNDGLTSLGLSIDGFRMIGAKTRQLSVVCQDKVIDLIASGYNRNILPYGWAALVTGLAGIECEIPEPEPLPEEVTPDRFYYQTEKMVGQLRTTLRDYWACFR